MNFIKFLKHKIIYYQIVINLYIYAKKDYLQSSLIFPRSQRPRWERNNVKFAVVVVKLIYQSV